MASTLERVRELVAIHGAVPLDRVGPRTDLHCDLHLAGADATDLVDALARSFGDRVRTWPWPRFVSLDEGLWPVPWGAPAPERLELVHLVAVLDRGEWFDP